MYERNYNKKQKRQRSKSPQKTIVKKIEKEDTLPLSIPDTALTVQAIHDDGINVPTTFRAALNGRQKQNGQMQ